VSADVNSFQPGPGTRDQGSEDLVGPKHSFSPISWIKVSEGEWTRVEISDIM